MTRKKPTTILRKAAPGAGVIALLAVQLLAGCSDSTGGAGLSARYVLVSVDGAPLPFTSTDHTFADGRLHIRRELADTIRFLNTTDFHRVAVRFEDFSPYEPITFEFSRPGRYSLDGTALTLVYTGDFLSAEPYILSGGMLHIERLVGPYCVEPAQPCGGSERAVEFVYAAR